MGTETQEQGIPIMRVPISLPCAAPVHPGTPDTSGPISERSEVCAIDAWWMVGKAMLCDHHMKAMLPEEYASMMAEGRLTEQEPWERCHRYDQDKARDLLFPGHPLASPAVQLREAFRAGPNEMFPRGGGDPDVTEDGDG